MLRLKEYEIGILEINAASGSRQARPIPQG